MDTNGAIVYQRSRSRPDDHWHNHVCKIVRIDRANDTCTVWPLKLERYRRAAHHREHIVQIAAVERDLHALSVDLRVDIILVVSRVGRVRRYCHPAHIEIVSGWIHFELHHVVIRPGEDCGSAGGV